MRLWATLLIIYAQIGFAQTVGELQQRLDQYNEAAMPEYARLHLDRGSYFAGDRIWYAIYLNNTPRAASSLSAVVYVELRDSRDTVVTRQKIKCREGYGHGDILLSTKLRTGNYKLVAYTLWMKNNEGSGTYQTTVPVVNLDLPVTVQNSSLSDLPAHAPLEIAAEADGELLVSTAAKGKLVAFDREEVLMVQEAAIGQKVPFSCGNREHDMVSFALLDESGELKAFKEIECPKRSVQLSIDVGKREIKPRQKFEVTVQWSDKFGVPVNGHISVSVRSAGPTWDQLPGAAQMPWLAGTDTRNAGASRKEMFVYPAEQATIPPVMQPSVQPVPFDVAIDVARARHIEEIGTNRNILRAFGAQAHLQKEPGYNIPFNFSYKTSDYQPMPALEDFIREVVPQIRIRKSSGDKKLLLRYVDENSLVYYFKQPALLLIDGVVHSGNDDFLQLSPGDIDRIDLTWAMHEINSMGVFSMADNGIIAIHSKSGTLGGNGEAIWKEYYQPLVFGTSGYDNPGDEVPVLGEPAYWNPFVRVNGKTRITVQAPDRPGELTIEVKGLTATGHMVSGEARVTVTLGEN